MRALIVGIGVVIATTTYGQLITTPNDTIEVGTLSTVFLYFEDNVSPPILGSGTDVEGRPDVLHTHRGTRVDLLARVPNFPTTNLAIESASGDVYNFILVYNEDLSNFIFQVKREAAVIQVERPIEEPHEEQPQEVLVNGLEVNMDTLRVLAKEVYDYAPVRSDIGTVKPKAKMKFTVNGIFVHGNHLLIRLDIVNNGNVKYDLDLIRFVIKPKGKQSAKRVAVQPLEKAPLFVYNRNEKEVSKGEVITQVWAFEKFTIGKKKSLKVEFWELNGDRSDDVIIRSEDLLQAISI